MGGTAKGRDRWGEREQQRTGIEAMIRGPCGVPSCWNPSNKNSFRLLGPRCVLGTRSTLYP